MFVHYSTTVPVGLGETERRLANIRDHLEEWAGIAYREGEELRARVGPTGALAKSVTLHLGQPEIHRRGVVYPLHWAAGGGAIFPELKADLVLSKLGAGHTTLAIDGTYQPPLGAVGRILDRAILGRVAEATVRKWLDRLAEAVTAPEPVR